MTGGSTEGGWARIHLGMFGESWIRTVASGCGFVQGPPAELDVQKADIQLTLLGMVDGWHDPTVQVQVKTTEQPPRIEDDQLVFAVDRPTFEALRNPARVVRRVLAVVWVEREGNRVRLQTDGTLLVGRAAWASLEGHEDDGNVNPTVRLPIANTVDASGLRRLVEQFGVPRSTPVPVIEPWTGS